MAAAAAAPVLRVTAKDCGAGFFAFMLYALNQLIWADSHGYVSRIAFGEKCRDGRPNRYYSRAHGENVWEYFFHPVSAAKESESSRETLLSIRQLYALHHTDRASVQCYPHGVHRHLKVPRWRYDELWLREMRERGTFRWRCTPCG